MRLQTKFNLGTLFIFALLAITMAALSINYVNITTIREAEDRVRIYTRAAWEIHDAKIERVQAASRILGQDQTVTEFLLQASGQESLSLEKAEQIRAYLETVRREQQLDVLNLVGPDGTVILRTRAPYNRGDSLMDDPMVRQAIASHRESAGTILMQMQRLDTEGSELVERCLAVGGEPTGMFSGAVVPVMSKGELVGLIEMGGLLNGAAEKVDRIRDAVFILLDVMFAGPPGPDGIELSRQFHRDPELKGTPIIILSGIKTVLGISYDVDPDDTWMPVKAFLQKPVKPDKLLAEIEKVIGPRS